MGGGNRESEGQKQEMVWPVQRMNRKKYGVTGAEWGRLELGREEGGQAMG